MLTYMKPTFEEILSTSKNLIKDYFSMNNYIQPDYIVNKIIFDLPAKKCDFYLEFKEMNYLPYNNIHTPATGLHVRYDYINREITVKTDNQFKKLIVASF